jgi:hypothetical protein
MRKEILLYLVFGFLAWLIAEYVTVWAERGIAEWFSYMPFIFAFYLAYPLLFAFLIYKLKWSNKNLFAATIAVGFALELTFFQNTGLLELPTALIYIPALMIIYCFLTLAPKKAVSLILPKQ